MPFWGIPLLVPVLHQTVLIVLILSLLYSNRSDEQQKKYLKHADSSVPTTVIGKLKILSALSYGWSCKRVYVSTQLLVTFFSFPNCFYGQMSETFLVWFFSVCIREDPFYKVKQLLFLVLYKNQIHLQIGWMCINPYS